MSNVHITNLLWVIYMSRTHLSDVHMSDLDNHELT